MTDNTKICFKKNKFNIILTFVAAALVISQVLSVLKMLETFSLIVCLCVFSLGLRLQLKKVNVFDFFNELKTRCYIEMFTYLEMKNFMMYVFNRLTNWARVKLRWASFQVNPYHMLTLVPFVLIGSFYLLENLNSYTNSDLQHILNYKKVGLGNLFGLNHFSIGNYFFTNFMLTILNIDIEKVYSLLILINAVVNMFVVNTVLAKLFESKSLGITGLGVFIVGLFSFSSSSGLVFNEEFSVNLMLASVLLINVYELSKISVVQIKALRKTDLTLSLAVMSFLSLKLTLLFAIAAIAYFSLKTAQKELLTKKIYSNIGLGFLPLFLFSLLRYLFVDGSLLLDLKSEFFIKETAQVGLFSKSTTVFYLSYILSLGLFLISSSITDFKNKIRIDGFIKFVFIFNTVLFVLDKLVPTVVDINQILKELCAVNAVVISISIYIVLKCKVFADLVKQQKRAMPALSCLLILSYVLYSKPNYSYAINNVKGYKFSKIINRIKYQSVRHSWTVIGEHSFFSLIYGSGYHLSVKDFLEKYQAKEYIWDPYDPETTIGTNYVYFVLNKNKLDQDTKQEKLLRNWIAEYEFRHEELDRFYEDESYVVYQLYRSPEFEKKIKKQMYLKKINEGS